MRTKNTLTKDYNLDTRGCDEGQHAFVRMHQEGVAIIANDSVGMIQTQIYLEPAQALELRQWLNMASETLQHSKQMEGIREIARISQELGLYD